MNFISLNLTFICLFGKSISKYLNLLLSSSSNRNVCVSVLKVFAQTEDPSPPAPSILEIDIRLRVN
jgi:hypothetical protein